MGDKNVILSIFGVTVCVFCLVFVGFGFLIIRRRRNKQITKRNESVLTDSSKLSLALGKSSLFDPNSIVKSSSRDGFSGSSSDSGTYVETSSVMKSSTFDSHHLSSPENMYRSAESDDSNKDHKSLGMLQFKASYSNMEKVLSIVVVKCTDLPLQDSSSDVYVKLQLLPEKKFRVKTFLQKTNTGLNFNQLFTFSNININQLKATSLHFVVLYFDRWSREHIVGELISPLDSLSLNLQKEITVVKDILPRQLHFKDDDSTGELLVSICHQPVTNRLTLVILKAANLPKMEVANTSGDPYIRMRIFANSKCIGKQKTRIKKRTCNPVYNEAFVFDLPNSLDLKNAHVEILVIDNDRMSKSEILGSVEIGIGRSLSGEMHWKEVLESPRNQISKWHKLN